MANESKKDFNAMLHDSNRNVISTSPNEQFQHLLKKMIEQAGK